MLNLFRIGKFRLRATPGKHRAGRHRATSRRQRGTLSFRDTATVQMFHNLRSEQAADEIAAAAAACLGRVWKIAVTGPATMRRSSLLAALALASELTNRTGAVVFTAEAKANGLWLGAR